MKTITLSMLLCVWQLIDFQSCAFAQTAIERLAVDPDFEMATTATVPENVMAEIRATAERLHPDDYQTQRYVIEKEASAFQTLQLLPTSDSIPESVLLGIRADAAKMQKGKYSAQLYVIDQETNAYRKLLNFERPEDIPHDVMRSIAKKAIERHPTHYSVQLYFIQNQMNAFRPTKQSGQVAVVDTAVSTAEMSDLMPNRPEPAVPDLIKIIKKAGLHEEMAWHKSDFDGEWIAQFRCYNGPKSGSGLSLQQKVRRSATDEVVNELNCELLADTTGTLHTISIEAELYNPNAANVTLQHGTKLIKMLLPDCPNEVLNAFAGGKQISVGKYSVSRTDHKGGTDITFLQKQQI